MPLDYNYQGQSLVSSPFLITFIILEFKQLQWVL